MRVTPAPRRSLSRSCAQIPHSPAESRRDDLRQHDIGVTAYRVIRMRFEPADRQIHTATAASIGVLRRHRRLAGEWFGRRTMQGHRRDAWERWPRRDELPHIPPPFPTGSEVRGCVTEDTWP